MPETPTDGPAPLMSATALPGWFSRVQRKRAAGAAERLCAQRRLLRHGHAAGVGHHARRVRRTAAAATATVGVIATLAPDDGWAARR